jgi:hypothetical protein
LTCARFKGPLRFSRHPLQLANAPLHFRQLLSRQAIRVLAWHVFALREAKQRLIKANIEKSSVEELDWGLAIMLDRIIRASIAHRWPMLLVALGLAILGAWSLTRLPINATPDITNIQMQINA